MKTMCSHEQDVLAAQRNDAWTDELREHLAECGDCAETLMVAGFLQEAAATAEAPVQEAGLVWWKMQLRARRDDAARAARPVVVAERVAMATVGLGLLGGIAWMSAEAAVAAIGLVVLSAMAGSVVWFAWSRN